MTDEQRQHINRIWHNGEAPDQCIGECLIGGHTQASCLKCDWQEPEPEV